MPETPLFPELTATTYTVRYHRARMLAVAIGCFLLWWILSIATRQASFHWANLLMVLSAPILSMTVLCALAPFHQPYLTFDTTGGVLRGPGGWWWSRSSMLMSFGLAMLLFKQVAVFDPQSGTLVVKGRKSSRRVFPRRGYDHLECSARLNALHEVRANGKRRLVTGSWQFDSKAWNHLTDQLQERVQ